MALRDATAPLMSTPALPDGPPYPCGRLAGWVGLDWVMPPGDLRLRRVDAGGPEPSPPFANLVGNREAWLTWPQSMDFLDPASVNHALKLRERDLYLRWWGAHLRSGSRVLDLGGGIGRFTQVALERGCDVELVDADLRSLRCALDHAAGLSGRLDLHWSTGEELPDLAPVDVVVAAELLNYVEDPARVLANVRRVLKPGGALLLSVEARWGWAFSTDTPVGTLDAWADEAPVYVPGDRFVRTYSEAALREALAGWSIELLVPTHYVLSGPFEAAGGQLTLDELWDWEARLRTHPVAAPLNRAWTVVAR